MNIRDDIKTIKGIGEKTAEYFAKLGITTVDNLINTFPRDYLSYEEPVTIKDAKIGVRQAVFCIISSFVEVKKIRGLTLVTMTAKDSTGTIRLTWFNQPYLKKVFHKGDSYVFVGEIQIKNNMRTMVVPEYYKNHAYKELMLEMQPVYPLTKGLSNKTFQKAVMSCREIFEKMDDYLDEEIITKYHLMEISDAYENIHYPANEVLLKNAIRRMAFDEFYKFIFEMDKLKNDNTLLKNSHIIVKGKEVADFVNDMPFSLTKGQQEAIEDILRDMGSDNVMNRLVQGDVGSGKTCVAACALFACAKQGYQAALMAPTEVLAKQHFDELSVTFSRYGLKTAGLFGSTSIKDKRKIYEDISNGLVDIVIGTHALIEDKVKFKNLGLVVTDEQHRFGVNQRKKLSAKGDFPHVLIMSATPIPRTLAIIMYSDLDISIISELPKGRKAIKNCVVGPNYRNTAYRFIDQQVKEKSQVYVICPMVNSSDVLDVSNVIDYTETLKENLAPDVVVKTLYGQMKADEKNEIMQEFMDNKIDVLVSTTVIEVGVNNPNATVMMVENAERFGLAQLHQLRGRVGRGKKQSYCIFINGKENDADSQSRLQVLENSNDGFFIASEDLRLRGPGDFFGIRQSGDMQFNIADIYNHSDMLKMAQDVYNEYGDRIIPFENRSTDICL